MHGLKRITACFYDELRQVITQCLAITCLKESVKKLEVESYGKCDVLV